MWENICRDAITSGIVLLLGCGSPQSCLERTNKPTHIGKCTSNVCHTVYIVLTLLCLNVFDVTYYVYNCIIYIYIHVCLFIYMWDHVFVYVFIPVNIMHVYWKYIVHVVYSRT